MTRRIRASLIAVSVATALMLAGAGVAYGYWSTSGAGAGTVPVSNTTPLVLSLATPTAALQPGGTSSVTLAVSNPNPTPIHVSSLALDTSQGTAGFAVDAGHSGCVLGALAFTTQTNSGAGWTIPPQVGSTNGTLAISLAGALAMKPSAGNACQGATFTVYLVAG